MTTEDSVATYRRWFEEGWGQGNVDLVDELYAHGEEVSYQALRAMPRLESAIKEALRLHPPLILVLRVVKEELEVWASL